MKIAVVNNMVPFLRGGAEELSAHLVRALEEHGHLVDEVRLPFAWEPLDVLPAQMIRAHETRLDSADKVIALKFPAYLVPHDDMTVWLFHQFRQAYDLFDAGLTPFGSGSADTALREAIARADAVAFERARQVFTIAQNVSDRLERYNGIGSQVLQPPMLDAELFAGGDAEPYVFAGGRINSMKRQEMLIRALAKTPNSVRLVIAGPPDTEETADALRRLADEVGVSDRLVLALRYAPRDEIADLVNHATACAYLPFDEDSIGYVTLEAAEAGKPVITTTDSGGVLSLVSGDSGWVVEPDVDSLAAALTDALAHPTESLRRGAVLRQAWHDLDATWPTTIERLLA